MALRIVPALDTARELESLALEACSGTQRVGPVPTRRSAGHGGLCQEHPLLLFYVPLPCSSMPAFGLLSPRERGSGGPWRGQPSFRLRPRGRTRMCSTTCSSSSDSR